MFKRLRLVVLGARGGGGGIRMRSPGGFAVVVPVCPGFSALRIICVAPTVADNQG